MATDVRYRSLSSSYLCRLREWFIHQLGRRLGLLFLSSINTQPTLNLMLRGRCCPSTVTSQGCACGSFTFPRQSLNHQPGHSTLFLSLRILVHFLGADWRAESSLFKTQGWVAVRGGGGCVTLLYVHRWSAILACLLPRQPLIMFWLEAWWNHVCWSVHANVCLSARISGVEPWPPGGPRAPGHGEIKGLSGRRGLSGERLIWSDAVLTAV